MSRLSEDIDFLQRAADAAGLVIYPGAGNATYPQGGYLTASRDALIALADELEVRRTRPTQYGLISYEAVWLLKSAHQLALHREDRDAAKVERFEKLGKYLRAAVEIDLVNARKSMGVLA
jgi:hypothetical protein